jgi:DNA-binding transcriptional LysR family regulator
MQLLAPPQTESDDPLELLRTRPFIRFDRNAIFGQMVESWLQKHKITVKDSMELEGLEAISSMVMANLGVSIVPKRCVRNMNPLPVKRLALGANAPARQLGLAYRDGNPKLTVIKAAEAAFLDAVRIGEFSA